MLPIQIIQGNRINKRPGESCIGNYNGNLNSWYYGLNNKFKNKMQTEYNSMGMLAQTNPENSPYYNYVPEYDKNLMNFLENLEKCKQNN